MTIETMVLTAIVLWFLIVLVHGLYRASTEPSSAVD
jgi:hypothetical protein